MHDVRVRLIERHADMGGVSDPDRAWRLVDNAPFALAVEGDLLAIENDETVLLKPERPRQILKPDTRPWLAVLQDAHNGLAAIGHHLAEKTDHLRIDLDRVKEGAQVGVDQTQDVVQATSNLGFDMG